jgi:hypothetical protein
MREALQTRRRFLIVGGTAAVAGCSTISRTTTDDEATDSTTEEQTATGPGDCKLRHDILDEERDHQIADRYRYENLSSTAQRYFEGALENPDSYYEVEDTDEPAPEYEYTDVVTKYEITYEGDGHLLGTWSGAGCRVEG